MYLSWEIKKVLPSNQNSAVFLRQKTGKIAGERNKKLRKTYSLVHTGEEDAIAHQFLQHQNSREFSQHALSHSQGCYYPARAGAKGADRSPPHSTQWQLLPLSLGTFLISKRWCLRRIAGKTWSNPRLQRKADWTPEWPLSSSWSSRIGQIGFKQIWVPPRWDGTHIETHVCMSPGGSHTSQLRSTTGRNNANSRSYEPSKAWQFFLRWKG